jgi:hypothetical protein
MARLPPAEKLPLALRKNRKSITSVLTGTENMLTPSSSGRV